MRDSVKGDYANSENKSGAITTLFLGKTLLEDFEKYRRAIEMEEDENGDN